MPSKPKPKPPKPTYTFVMPDLAGLSKEEVIQLAVNAVRASWNDDTNTYILSLRQAAIKFNIPHATLTARFNGRSTRQQARESQRRLTRSQEDVLSEWLCSRARRAIPVTPQGLSEIVSCLVGEAFGASWTNRYLNHHPELRTRYTQSLEKCRASNVNPAIISEFFDVFTSVVKEFNIQPNRLFNMDEKGVQLGIGKKVVAIVDRDLKTAYHLEDGNREMVTVIECVCADGTVIHPNVIFKGKTRALEWGKENACNARYFFFLVNVAFTDQSCSISISERGWTDQELGYYWLKHDFDPATRPCALDPITKELRHWRLLVLDGHNSHCTFQFCQCYNLVRPYFIFLFFLASHLAPIYYLARDSSRALITCFDYLIFLYAYVSCLVSTPVSSPVSTPVSTPVSPFSHCSFHLFCDSLASCTLLYILELF